MNLDSVHGNILSCLLFCPLVGALIVALLPQRVAREGAFCVAFINFVLSLHLWFYWNRVPDGANGFKFEQNVPWIPQFGLSYHLGVDGLSLFLILLTTFLTPLAILASWNSISQRVQSFMVCMLVLEAMVLGVFCALDVLLYYIFWEAVLIPSFILILGWGGARRAYAATKFFLFTLLGGLTMWLAMLYVYLARDTQSFDYVAFQTAARSIDSQSPNLALALFGAFALAFAIKVPLFPFHSWQPDTYDEAPLSVTVLLAAVLTKMGTYGFARFAIPMFPNAAQAAAPLMVTLALISIVYGALIAVRQTNLKRLLAYSSLSHLGLIVLGLFAALMIPDGGTTAAMQQSHQLAFSGAVLQMLSHGLSTAALFFLLNVLFDRRSATATDWSQTTSWGGLAAPMPRYTVLFWVALFSSIGLPGLSGFVGEYLILQGSMAANFWIALVATSSVIWGAIYMLRMFRRVMYGETTREEHRTLADVRPREYVVAALVLAVSVWIGVAPQSFLNIIGPRAAQVADSSRAALNHLPQSQAQLAQSNNSSIAAP
jgi:NADH-quinone oxidoreductase subunit M